MPVPTITDTDKLLAPMFDLDKSIAAWRRRYEHDPAFTPEDVRELERHVRDQVQALADEGLAEEEAFLNTMQEIGEHEEVRAAYRVVRWGKRRREHSLLQYLIAEAAMLKNYLKIAYRILFRQKGYSFLNVAGLALGMACFILIFQYVAFEYSFDRFHAKTGRLYRLAQQVSQPGEQPQTFAFLGYLAAPTYTQEVPEVIRYARVHPDYGSAYVSYKGGEGGEQVFQEWGLLYADSTLLSMFTIPIVKGNRAGALTRPQTLLISESAARKYFGDDDPMGKILDITGGVTDAYTVAGVFKDLPANSHIQFDFLLPMQDLLTSAYADDDGWHRGNFITYVELNPGVDPARVEHSLTEGLFRRLGDEITFSNEASRIRLQPLTTLHFDSETFAPTRTGNQRTVYFLALIALATLVIALINYVNLSTARALNRAKEVGVRKVVGANWRQLLGQFLLESAVMNLSALVLAVGLAMGLTPVLNRWADVHLIEIAWTNGATWGVFLLLFLLSVLLSGLYPAFVLSSFKPVGVLKGRAGAFGSRVALRKALVVLQFGATIVLLVGTGVVYAQLGYMRGMDLGLTLEQILTVAGPRVLADGADQSNTLQEFADELRRIPAVEDIAFSSALPGLGFDWYGQLRRATADPATERDARAVAVDHRFADMYGLQILAGEPFVEGMAGGGGEGPDRPVFVNEAAVGVLGLPTAEAALGERISMSGSDDFIIHGVVKDFNWSSAHELPQPVMLYYQPGGGNISLRVSATNLPGTIAAVKKIYQTVFPGNPFSYGFADQVFDEQYKNDERFASLFGIFAGIAIFIACLGLFGLAAFTAERRSKEIGIRKVLGATVSSIVTLLSKDFLKLVIAGFVIAVPVAYFFMSRWLEDFAYRIDLGPGIFLLAGAAALVIALATVGYQAVRAATTDPVRSLRYE